MRSISLVQRREYEFKGTVFENAVALVDIANDGANEFCCANTSGDLHVYKGIRSEKAWRANRGLGAVVVLCGGRVLDPDEVVLVVINREGTCHVLADRHPQEGGELTVLSSEQLVRNSKVAILEDIDDDGCDELFVGSTDRFVRCYKWQHAAQAHPEAQTRNRHSFDRKSVEVPILNTKASTPREGCNKRPSLESEPSGAIGHFVLMKQFSLFAQVGSIAVCRTADGLNQLIASQPNGGYCTLGVYCEERGFTEPPDTPNSVDSPPSASSLPRQESYPTFYPMKVKRNHTHTATEVIGGILRKRKRTGILAICTQDGNFAILDNYTHSRANKTRSSHRWLAISKVDVTDNGDEEIVLCSTDGMTYIIDPHMDIVSFDLAENVAAFCAGKYSVDEYKSYPCLCYVTLNGKIHLYYEVWIETMKVKCVHGALIEKIQQKAELAYLLDMLKLPNGEIDHQKVQNLVKNIWSVQT